MGFFLILFRVKAAQNELGTQILADFEEAFPSQGSKVTIVCHLSAIFWLSSKFSVWNYCYFSFLPEASGPQQRASGRLPGGQRAGPAHQTGGHQKVHPTAPLRVPGVVSGKSRCELEFKCHYTHNQTNTINTDDSLTLPFMLRLPGWIKSTAAMPGSNDSWWTMRRSTDACFRRSGAWRSVSLWSSATSPGKRMQAVTDIAMCLFKKIIWALSWT